jgi:hypothetical protein
LHKIWHAEIKSSAAAEGDELEPLLSELQSALFRKLNGELLWGNEGYQRLARELHDSINEYHAALGVSLDRLSRCTGDPERRCRESPNLFTHPEKLAASDRIPPHGTTQRLWGISLSPDGTKLAISDAQAGVIYLLNPASPSVVRTFSIPSQFGFVINPCGLVVSDLGNIYYAVVAQGGTGADQFFKLDTNTGAVTDYHLNGPGESPTDMYLRVAISSDNTHVYFNELGNVFVVDTATDKLSSAPVETGCCYGDYELSLASDQLQVTAGSYLYDLGLNAESYYALNDREILTSSEIYGAKFSADGRLLFQPSTNGVEVLDGRLGNLLNRVSLPVALSPNYDALVDDGTDNVLIAITGTGDGIAIVDLTSITEPPLLPYAQSAASSTYRPTTTASSTPEGKPRAQQSQSVRPSRVIPHVTRSILPHTK